jgi:hypothetical protein
MATLTSAPAAVPAAAPAAVPTAAPAYLGIDVSKARLDVHFSDGRADAPRVLDNEPAAIKRFVATLAQATPPHAPLALVALEATGGYEDRVLYALLDAGVPVVRLNPLRVRRFAQSRGQLAKNDRLDAQLLADFARCNADRLRPMDRPSDTARMLKQLVARRRQLVEQCTANKAQLQHASVPAVKKSIRATLRHLQGQIATLEAAIQEQIDADARSSRPARTCCWRSPAWARPSAACWSPSCRSWVTSTAARSPRWWAWRRSRTSPARSAASGTSAAAGRRCGPRCTWPRWSPRAVIR